MVYYTKGQVRRIIEESGKSVEDLAELYGVHAGTIYGALRSGIRRKSKAFGIVYDLAQGGPKVREEVEETPSSKLDIIMKVTAASRFTDQEKIQIIEALM